MMKISNKTPRDQRSAKQFSPLRWISACGLIAMLLVATSVGLTYARYTNISTVSERVNYLGNDIHHADNVVIGYIDRDDTSVPTVLNYKDDVIVTVPRGITAENKSIAYALIVRESNPSAYDATLGKYVISMKLQVVGLLPGANSRNGVQYNSATKNNSFGLKIKAETDITDIVGKYGTTTKPTDYDDGYVEFSKISYLGTANGTSAVSLSYNRTNWDDVADTSWFDRSDPRTEYSLDSAKKLAGLAELVNDGTDFENVTINLTDDITLFGPGGEGDLREWTPIGTADHPFKGNFDGGNHTIKGLTLSGGIEAENVGLFGVVEGNASSYIKDFTVESPLVYGKEDHYIGTIVGKATGYQLSGVTINALHITGDSDAVMGLLVGQANGEFEQFGCQISIADGSCEYIGEDNSSVAHAASTEASTEDLTVAPSVAETEASTESPE